MAASMGSLNNSEILTLIDEDNKSYTIEVSIDDVKKAKNGKKIYNYCKYIILVCAIQIY